MESGDDGMTVRREAFTVRLKPGVLAEWVRRHDGIWPDLLAEQRRCGFNWMTVYAADPVLVVTSEVTAPDAWERLVDTEVHKQWVETMRDLSESALPDSTMDRVNLPEVLHLDFARLVG